MESRSKALVSAAISASHHNQYIQHLPDGQVLLLRLDRRSRAEEAASEPKTILPPRHRSIITPTIPGRGICSCCNGPSSAHSADIRMKLWLYLHDLPESLEDVTLIFRTAEEPCDNTYRHALMNCQMREWTKAITTMFIQEHHGGAPTVFMYRPASTDDADITIAHDIEYEEDEEEDAVALLRKNPAQGSRQYISELEEDLDDHRSESWNQDKWDTVVDLAVDLLAEGTCDNHCTVIGSGRETRAPGVIENVSQLHKMLFPELRRRVRASLLGRHPEMSDDEGDEMIKAHIKNHISFMSRKDFKESSYGWPLLSDYLENGKGVSAISDRTAGESSGARSA